MPDINVEKIVGALKSSNGKCLMLADGFVDEVWEIVSSRASAKDYVTYKQMAQFADRILGSGTGGVGLELILKRRSFGGFVSNTSYATSHLGVDTTMVGVFGEGSLDRAFDEISKLCHIFSVGAPGVTHIFEFEDGKVMMSHIETVQDLRWQSIVDRLGTEKTLSLLVESNIIGVGYWSLLPGFDEIVEQICAHLPQDNKTRRFFFDFADFRKKDEASLLSTLEKLKKLNEKFPMTLSVNEHEAAALFAMYNQTLDNEGSSVQEKVEYVRKQIGLDEFVVHTPHYAASASSIEKPAFATCLFCEKPLRTAGAGDTFNGGYMAAVLAGLDATERLHVANAAVGYFLRNAAPPDIDSLCKQLNA